MLNELLERASKHAEAYDGDDRQDIKTDVLNAFYAGAAFGAKFEREACAKVCEDRIMRDMSDEDMEAQRCADAIRSRSNNGIQTRAAAGRLE